MENKNTLAMALSLVSLVVVILFGALLFLRIDDLRSKVDSLNTENGSARETVMPTLETTPVARSAQESSTPTLTTTPQSTPSAEGVYQTKDKKYRFEDPQGYTVKEDIFTKSSTILRVLDAEDLAAYENYEAIKYTLGDHGGPTYGIELTYEESTEKIDEQKVYEDPDDETIESDATVQLGQHRVRKLVLSDDSSTYGDWKNIYFFKIDSDLFSVHVTEEHVSVVEDIITSLEHQ